MLMGVRVCVCGGGGGKGGGGGGGEGGGGVFMPANYVAVGRVLMKPRRHVFGVPIK